MQMQVLKKGAEKVTKYPVARDKSGAVSTCQWHVLLPHISAFCGPLKYPPGSDTLQFKRVAARGSTNH
jgi:hypothetical protein